MAALSCMPMLQLSRRIDSRPPRGGGTTPELSTKTSAAAASVASPASRRRCAACTASLRWDSRSSIAKFKQARSNVVQSASIASQQEGFGTLSDGEDSAQSGSSVGLVQVPRKAAELVQEFYDGFNRRDPVGLASLFTEDCEYEDFNFSYRTTGREDLLKFFEKMMSSFGTELTFVVDDMTWDDPNAVGVIWHLDWRGKAFPFSRGCSFYRCVVNSAGERQIRFARDIVEPATKPGDVSIGALRLVTSLFERFPQLADRL